MISDIIRNQKRVVAVVPLDSGGHGKTIDTSSGCFLGFEDEKFSFQHLGNPIDFLECSAVNDQARDPQCNLDQVREWLAEKYS